MTDWLNKRLGRFQIVEHLGGGATAQVYKAFHPTLERDVAIKVIHPRLATDPGFVKRFHSEAKIIAGLRHPGIVRVYDFDVQDGTFYMVIEFLPGESLQDRLAGLAERGERLPLTEALTLFQGMVRAVAYAHRQGVVHRDLKPANVLLTPEGQPVLTDFGLAKIVGSERFAQGAIIGTPSYMSPEQGSGEAGSVCSDLYSLGVMLYELCTNTLPFVADSPVSVILMHLDEPLPSPRLIDPQIPVSVEQIIQKAMEKGPASRFQSAQELLVALDDLVFSEDAQGAAQEPPLDARCPYRGLEAFQEEHVEFFFGRETLVGQLVERLRPIGVAPQSDAARGVQLLAVLGASGSGKSSLVRAGLVPALRNGDVPGSSTWAIRVIQPGHHPLDELAADLASVVATTQGELLRELKAYGRALHLAICRAWASAPLERRLVLVVDQFEEVFTLCQDSLQRERFVENLLYATAIRGGRVVVVLAMRADFYHRCAAYRDLANRISACQVLVGPMREAELHRAIEQPALRVGLQFEPGLVDTILADVARQPGGLPLLQHALLELWEQRQGRLLTLSAYWASGGVIGAISQRADNVYGYLGREEQAAVRRIMLRLTQPGQGTEDTRRRVRRGELLSGSVKQHTVVEAVLLRLADARLITTSRDAASGEDMVDVAHEALIRSWARLQSWINEDRMALHIHRQLTEAAETWAQNDRDASYLYRGGRLAQAREWHEAHSGDLNELESAFLSVSQEAAEAIEREREAARQREVAQMQALLAEQRQRLEAQEQAHSLHLATSAQLALYEHNTDLALALALEANRVDEPSPQAELVLADAAYAPGTRRVFRGHTAAVHDLAVGPGGKTLLSASADRTLILWNVQTGEIVRRLQGHTEGVYTVDMIPGGGRAISGSADGTLLLWDLASGKSVGRLEGHSGAVRCVTVAPDGRSAISGSADQTLILWDLETGQVVHRLQGHQGAVFCVAISPDGRTALSGSEDRSVALWDLDTGRVIYHMKGLDKAEQALISREGHFDSVWGVLFFPDGKQALSVSEDEFGLVWDLDTGQVSRSWSLGISTMSVCGDAGGRRALLGTLDSRVTMLDLHSGEPEMSLLGHSGRVNAVAFGPDGRTAFSGAIDGTLRHWDLRSGAELRRTEYQESMIPASVAVSPDGRVGLTGFWYGDLILWDYESGAEIRRLIGHSESIFAGVAFHPNGQMALSGAGDIFAEAEDSTLRLWDLQTGKEIRRFEGHTRNLYDMDLSPDGSMAVSASDDGTVRRWDLQSGAQQVLLDLSPQAVRSVAFSPDGRSVLVGPGKGRSDVPDYGLRLLDLETGMELSRFSGHEDAVARLSFSPNGQRALSGGLDKVVILWDVARGAEVRRLVGHAGACLTLAFATDRYALSAGFDGTIIVWDLASGAAIRRLFGHHGNVLSVALGPQGRTVLSTCADGTVREWRIDLTRDELLAWVAANRHVLELTAQQRAQYQIQSKDG